MINKLSVIAIFVVFLVPTANSQSVSSSQREELKSRLSSYGQCQATCAEDLAVLIVDKGVDDALAVAGLIKGGKSKPLSGPTGKLAFYAVLRKIYNSVGEVIDAYGVCSSSCDALHKDVVELGRSGLLGPITKGQPIPEDWFEDPRVRKIWDEYIKPLDPSDLPWQFHNDKRWAEIMNTA